MMLPSGLAEHIDNQEDLARFLTQSSQFKSMLVKPAAFLPNPKDRETSVMRHGPKPLDNLWDIGIQVAGSRNLYGAAILKAGSIRKAGLEVRASEPPPRHAVIDGWPWLEFDPELQKAKQKEMAIILASIAGPPVLR